MKYGSNLLYGSIFNEENKGVSEDSLLIRKHAEEAQLHQLKPISRLWTTSVVRFNNLKAEWEKSTSMLSSMNKIAMHPAYQQIIGMGPLALPYIFQSMRVEPGHWFWALKSITGEDPVPPELRGKIKEMTEIWLEWGKRNMYLPPS